MAAAKRTIVFAALSLIVALPSIDEGFQNKKAQRAPEKVVPLPPEQVAKLVEKRKAFRIAADARRREALSRFEASRQRFTDNQRAKLEESNRAVLERIKRGK